MSRSPSTLSKPLALFALPLVAVAVTACPEVTPDDGDNEGEVVTTVTLTFTPQGGGDALVFAFDDPENDGDPVIDDVVLSDADDYDLAVRFENKLADPAEDITAEVEDEGQDHQVFFFGRGVSGPASDAAGALVTHSYADTDDNDLPVGLESTIVTDATGSAELQVVLRHMPPENDVAVKTADTAATFKDEGEAAIGGSSDAAVTFPLTVE